MKIDCANCGRAFELDAQRLANIAAVQCLCGNRLQIRAEGDSTLRLGKYSLINRIATGGMGEIYYGKVSGIEGFEKEVAIKKMLPHLSADRDFINMMVKEAKLTVLLNHPNIVGVYDLAKEGGEYYIAMEYVPGVTVGSILEQARKMEMMLPPEVPIHVTLQLLRGLGYAHNLPTPSGERIAILHRDITPQNILVTRNAFVKITDFGIAKAVNEISTTSPGMIKGKLGYIAPEQLEGKEPDQRVDLFCAAILLWEMFAVRRLFKGATEVDTFRLISDCKVPSLDEFRTDIPANVEAVLSKALARDPRTRYARAEEFATALSQAIFPRTPDDFAEITELFFEEHPEFFAPVDEHKGGPGLVPIETTRAMPVTGINKAPESLELVSKFVKGTETEELRRPAKRSWGLVAGAVAGLAVIVGLSVALFVKSNRRAPAAQAPTSMFPTPRPPPATPPPAQNPAVTAPPAPAPAPKPAAAPRHAESGRLERTPLSKNEISSALQRTYPSILRCLHQYSDGNTSRVDATIGIDISGKVNVLGFEPHLGSESAGCISGVLKKVSMRRHPDPDLQVKLPIMIRKLEQ